MYSMFWFKKYTPYSKRTLSTPLPYKRVPSHAYPTSTLPSYQPSSLPLALVPYDAAAAPKPYAIPERQRVVLAGERQHEGGIAEGCADLLVVEGHQLVEGRKD